MTESVILPCSERDLPASTLVREGQTVAGKYLIGRTLGVGGMGMVFAARDIRLDRQVAIKVLLPRLVASQTAMQRFLHEARAATRITSEHVVRLLEIDTLPDGTPLLVMEHLEGRDLRVVLCEDGPVTPRQAVDYLLQALQAVAESHALTIVHRDLKPSNLFLTARADGTPLIKVLDFGIAKTLTPDTPNLLSLTNAEDVRLGSPTYSSPEQLNNPRNVDTRADIWSLGVTLYELVSGSPPFQAQSFTELVARILNSSPDPLKPRGGAQALPEGFADIIWKCLKKERDQRYANTAELALALAPFGSDDARLSLHRILGIKGAPVASRSIRTFAQASADSAAGEATRSVGPAGPAIHNQDSRTTGSPIVSAVAPPRRRMALMAGTAAVALVLLAWLQEGPERRLALPVPIASAATVPFAAGATSQVTPELAAAPRLLVAATAASASGASATPISPTVHAKPSSNRPWKSSRDASTESSATTAAARGVAVSDAERGGAALESTAASSSAPPAQTPQPVVNGLGPSPLIERLIEQRH